MKVDNSFQINQALQQLREVAAQAGNEPVSGRGEAPGADFTRLMREALENVNGLQQTSSAMTDAVARGEEVNLTEVMVATQKSRVAFEALKETRNRLLEAYQEVSNMQV
ncbi:flagellar hook-basal body complex protein FliE [Alkalilimnicola ehrlichii MLHE-1]|uniref:Flagellar hook-basal body complex protein FliE n=1 Tax=Alkalilimnicola ehrlichii (strain ATCC BAA-1101 / DSM 17681 / MLHE-1) TaxID=187272 RepID=Q0AAS5_ALKEH|nr:flagellar hook-basal body complex protein FliE [Alkalilimnicola ehrlichii]ABI56062.1 flagellar hook-basal body complex subunit FliE [Alkalilimnicola ehrlichii MLHE-1]